MAHDSVTTTELAQATGVPYRTVVQWISAGRISAEKNSRGDYRIPAAEVERVRTEIRDRAVRTINRLVESA